MATAESLAMDLTGDVGIIRTAVSLRKDFFSDNVENDLTRVLGADVPAVAKAKAETALDFIGRFGIIPDNDVMNFVKAVEGVIDALHTGATE